jgi:tetratricopeptide (TPR) repeat protein
MDNHNNVIPLPGLYERYIEQGTEAVENRKYIEAEKYFRIALDIEPDGVRARFGFILSLYQNGKLTEAKENCEAFIHDEVADMDDYFDCLHVYTSILRDLGEYDQAAAVLKMALQNQYAPNDDQIEKCRQWLRFFLETRKETGDLPTTVHEQADSTEFTAERVEDSEIYRNKLEEVKEMLADREGDPYIKSLVLKDLKLNGLNVTVLVHKFGEDLTVNIEEMNDAEEEELYQEVSRLLSEMLESDNPTLYNMALQLWEHYT